MYSTFSSERWYTVVEVNVSTQDSLTVFSFQAQSSWNVIVACSAVHPFNPNPPKTHHIVATHSGLPFQLIKIQTHLPYTHQKSNAGKITRKLQCQVRRKTFNVNNLRLSNSLPKPIDQNRRRIPRLDAIKCGKVALLRLDRAMTIEVNSALFEGYCHFAIT